MINEIFIRRCNKVTLGNYKTDPQEISRQYVATVAKNFEAYGYSLSESLFGALSLLNPKDISRFYENIIPVLKKAKGAHRKFKPMYPNFPAQVMEASNAELFINAIVHYWTEGKMIPDYKKETRFPLADLTKLQQLDLGTTQEVYSLCSQIIGSNASLSEQDKEDIKYFLGSISLDGLVPEKIPQKETMAFVASILLEELGDDAVELISNFCKTSTDVLRLAVAMSDGDISLAEKTKFKSFKQKERRLLLALLEKAPNQAEEMATRPEVWKRLRERLHPGDYSKVYPKAAAAFKELDSTKTFNSRVETAILRDKLDAAILLTQRPGMLARRLDQLLRDASGPYQEFILDEFNKVAEKISTPVLLQVANHFKNRQQEYFKNRVFFPKGSLAKVHSIENKLPPISPKQCFNVVNICETALMGRFKELPSLGKVYLDPRLRGYLIPFSQRSASKALRTIVRGSRIPLEDNCKTIRLFLWWKNEDGRTDIDLSAVLLNDQFGLKQHLAYYNLRAGYGWHSGDIVDAPNGASEFIDISIENALKAGSRYLVMVLNSYTGQPYKDLPECFAGWMSREHPDSGEVYEPKTVQNRIDLTADSKMAIPLVIDLAERTVIWLDLSIKNNPHWVNNAAANSKSTSLIVQSLVEMKKTSLFDLFELHAEARATAYVDDPSKADTVFSEEDGIQYRLEEISSKYLI